MDADTGPTKQSGTANFHASAADMAVGAFSFAQRLESEKVGDSSCSNL